MGDSFFIVLSFDVVDDAVVDDAVVSVEDRLWWLEFFLRDAWSNANVLSLDDPFFFLWLFFFFVVVVFGGESSLLLTINILVE